MARVKGNPLICVIVRRGAMPETEVTFQRETEQARSYYPGSKSLIRLEPHLNDCEVMLAPRWLTITKWVF